jgi:AcrR family transcriptional regulator
VATNLEKEAMSSRPTRLPRDQRRIQLLDAASEVFASKGYHAAAMDEIADAAGVSKPVLYQHFPSKLDLYLALLDQSCERLVEVLEGALSSTDDNANRVNATVAAFFEFVSTSGDFRFVFESDLTGEYAVQRRLARVNGEISDAIADVITEDTSLPRQQAKLLAVSLVGIAQVSARYWISGGTSAITLEEAKHLVSNLAWRGISAFPLTEHDKVARTSEAAFDKLRPHQGTQS